MKHNATKLALKWLEAYQGKSLEVVDMYSEDAVVECADGETLIGKEALEAFWPGRFVKFPAFDLMDVRSIDESVISVAYKITSGIATATLGFDSDSGKIVWQRCTNPLPESSGAVPPTDPTFSPT